MAAVSWSSPPRSADLFGDVSLIDEGMRHLEYALLSV